MKTQIKLRLIIMLVVTFGLKSFAQDSTTIVKEIFIPKRTQIFSLSPISKKVDLVNGMVLGAGHFENSNVNYQKINGINIEVNPDIILIPYLTMVRADIIYDSSLIGKPLSDTLVTPKKSINRLKINGFNISSGAFMVDTDFNGLNISTFNIYNNCNGLNIAPIFTSANKMNGLTISSINVFNNLNGVSIGLINKSNKMNGIQIGLYNSSNSCGLQLGFWNTNNKRTMPFINW